MMKMKNKFYVVLAVSLLQTISFYTAEAATAAATDEAPRASTAASPGSARSAITASDIEFELEIQSNYQELFSQRSAVTRKHARLRALRVKLHNEKTLTPALNQRLKAKLAACVLEHKEIGEELEQYNSFVASYRDYQKLMADSQALLESFRTAPASAVSAVAAAPMAAAPADPLMAELDEIMRSLEAAPAATTRTAAAAPMATAPATASTWSLMDVASYVSSVAINSASSVLDAGIALLGKSAPATVAAPEPAAAPASTSTTAFNAGSPAS